LDLLATITLEEVSISTYAPFPALLQFFRCILEVVFCRCSAPPAILPKSPQLYFIFNQGNREVWWVVDDSHVVCDQEFPGEKEV
jgi:hypothetical protein